jgi:hypothetical protein
VARWVLARQGTPATTTPPPPATNTPGTPPGTPGADADGDAAKALHEKMKGGDRESALRHAMTLSGRYDALKAAYPKAVGSEMDDDITRMMGFKPDAARLRAYLRRGSLRTADKIYIAVVETGTDNETLFRLLPQAQASGGGVSRDFAEDYGTDFPDNGKLLDGRPDRIAGVLGEDSGVFNSGELSGSDWVKGMALLTYGRMRAADTLRAALKATVSTDGSVDAALHEAAKSAGSGPAAMETVAKEYEASYKSKLSADIEERLGKSSDVAKRAALLLAGKWGAKERIKIAVTGLGTDWKEIWSALQDATPAELVTLRAEWDSKEKDGLYDLITSELTTTQADRGRMEALLQAGAPKDGEKIGIDVLVNARGVVVSEHEAVIRLTLEDARVAAAFAEVFDDSAFRQRFTAGTSSLKPIERGEVVVRGTLAKKLTVAADVETADGARRLLLTASDADKAAIRGDDALVKRLRNMKGGEGLEDLLAPTDPMERKKWLEGRVSGEGIDTRASGPGSALGDELRELDVAAKAVKDPANMTPEERARMEAAQGRADTALTIFQRYSAEMQALAVQALTAAAGVIITVATGGAGGVAAAELISWQVARMAMAQGLANLVINKAVKGDKFEMTSGEGAAVFAGGAVQGAVAVMATPAALAALSPAYRGAANGAARAAAAQHFETVGAGAVKSMTEGAIGGGATAAFETAAKSETWRDGIIKGFKDTLTDAVVGAAAGGVTAGLMHAGIAALKGQLFGGTPGPGGVIEPTPVAKIDPVKAEKAAGDLLRTGQGRWQHYAGLTSQMGEHEAAYTTALMNGRRKLAAEVCIAAEEDLQREGVSWKLAKGETPGQALEISLTPATGEKADAARAKIRRALRDRTGGNLEAAGMEDGGPASMKDEPPPSSGGDKEPGTARGVDLAGKMNRSRPPVNYPDHKAAGRAFTAEIKENPNFEAAVVVDRRDGSARLVFGDETACDVPFGEHFEQVKHYHPGSGVKTDVGQRTPSYKDLGILHEMLGPGRTEARSMIRWTDAGGVPHWTPYGVDSVEGVVWVRMPGAEPKKFPISIMTKPASGRFEFDTWVREVMAAVAE